MAPALASGVINKKGTAVTTLLDSLPLVWVPEIVACPFAFPKTKAKDSAEKASLPMYLKFILKGK